MNLATKLFLAFVSIGSVSLIAQDDSYKSLLKRTSVCVHKAQKQMMAGQKTDVGGKLGKAVMLQSYAVKLYSEKKNAEAACVSLEARKLSFEIVKEISNLDHQYAQATSEEIALATNCATPDALVKEAKKSMKNISEHDKDYVNPSSLNETNIDIK